MALTVRLDEKERVKKERREKRRQERQHNVVEALKADIVRNVVEELEEKK